MSISVRFLYSVPTGNLLGEGVTWDASQQRVWWTDIEARTLSNFCPSRRALTQYSLPYRLCSFGLTDKPGTLIAAFDRGVALYEVDSGKLSWLYRLQTESAGLRLNDGRVDAAGRFWCGSMIEQDTRVKSSGSLYRLSGYQCQEMLSGFEIFNGLAWSPDNRWIYCADSARNLIFRHAFNLFDGSMGEGEVFASTPAGIHPDGSVIDSEGCLWNAQWGGARVVRYRPDGQIDLIIPMPTSQCSCVSFGGAKLDLLFVSSASTGLDAETLASQPQAGDLLVFQVQGTRGLAGNCFSP
ncbi:SMP-30/gluconolactonase/LRE family protein [Shewanella sp. GXUN23E]|uniref:SMP-30/gluconolactonase/LRE family protein n=1 Tax=Shewanella sp. GXUN23E TaxID=3422498 RepID=UPI003D7E35DA